MKQTEFTTLLYSLKEDYNLTFKELANLLGFSSTYIFDLMQGNREPSKKIALSIIGTFNLNFDQQRVLYDSIAASTGDLPYDVVNFLQNNQKILQKIIYEMQEQQLNTNSR